MFFSPFPTPWYVFAGVSWPQVVLLQGARHSHCTVEGSWGVVPAYAHICKSLFPTPSPSLPPVPPHPHSLLYPLTLTPLIGEQPEGVLLEAEVLWLHQGPRSNGPQHTESSSEGRLLHGTLQTGEEGKVIPSNSSVIFLQYCVQWCFMYNKKTRA